jgi:hypothetical protein
MPSSSETVSGPGKTFEHIAGFFGKIILRNQNTYQNSVYEILQSVPNDSFLFWNLRTPL